MNKEEAIICLQGLLDNPLINKGSYLAQAIEMAIQALSQEPTEENIHREREQAYMQGYEDASKRFRQEPCDDAISIRKDVLKCRVGNIVAYNVDWLKKHWQMEMDIVCGVKPCDDAVSRILQRMWNCRGKHTTSIDKVKMEQIIRDELPPVTQKKSRKWIYDRTRDWDGECKYECSECGMGSDVDYAYCMRCGAKMESEV